MPLFSNRHYDDRQHAQQETPSMAGENVEQAPPGEHTRLLPNPIDSTSRPTLMPDDPAVSPYNLWSIRMLRYLTLVFTAATFAWWIVLLVSTFATPPGLHTRGSGFLAFSYASLSLANLLLTLVFFSVPSKAVRVLAVAMSIVLLLDMILLLCVQQVRYEERWVGIVSVIWALLISLWALLIDGAVKWGKGEEEERLTGRAETRRTLTEWLAVLLSMAGYAILVVAVALITLTLILRAVDAGVAPPGGLYQVDNGRYRIHVYCHGKKTDVHGIELPTVLFEGDEEPFEQHLWDFAANAVKNGSISRYCFADRPGIAWSDTAPSPLSAGFAVDALSEALGRAGEKGPWILASAGIGSIYSRVFSSRHGHDAKGLLLIDPLHEDLLGAVANPGRGFNFWLRGVISPLGLGWLPGAVFWGGTAGDRIYGQAARQGGKATFAKLQESLVADSFTKRDVRSSRRTQKRDLPLVVISSGIEVNRSELWERQQKDLTMLTDELKHWDIVSGAPHQVWETLEGRQQIEERLRQLVTQLN